MVSGDNDPAPLDYGKLAPAFSLESITGQTVTRSQFRGKQALVLIFFELTPEAQVLLCAIGGNRAEYEELNARVFGIGPAPREQLQAWAEPLKLPYTLLADAQGTVWKAYTHSDKPGYAVFVLDLYGGVDAQQVAGSVGDLPNAATILEWTRATQYRCNI